MLMERGYGVMPPEWKVEEDASPGFSRIYFLEQGEVWYKDIHGTTLLHPGYMYIFRSHAPFSIYHNPASPIGCLWCHMDIFPTMLTELTALSISDNPELYHLSAVLFHAVTHTNPNENYLQLLADAFLAFFYKENIFPTPDKKTAEWIRYIREHCTENTSIKDLSRHFGYTPEHFIRVYHEKAGISPCQDRLRCRLNLAAGLLKKGVSVTAVAGQVGYQDIKSFSRAFKGHFGMSPGQYCKQDFSRA